MRIIYYCQTFSGLAAILKNPQCVDVIQIASIHFDTNEDQMPCIHLNGENLDDSAFDELWEETKRAHRLGVKIHLTIGGAEGCVYKVLFNDFETYYGLLKTILEDRPWISGIDLRIKEHVSLDDVKKLINQVKRDFGADFVITITTDQASLFQKSYKDLFISWFNVHMQDYASFEQLVNNGYQPSRLVSGMISSQFEKESRQKPKHFRETVKAIRAIRVKYPDMGGVYCDAHSSPQGPEPVDWVELMHYLVK